MNTIQDSIGSYFSAEPLLSSLDELDQKKVIPEKVVRVNGSRVLYANYALLQQDFPHLNQKVFLKKFPILHEKEVAEQQIFIHLKIDEWLVKYFSFISQSQAAQSVVNSPISTGSKMVRAHRPPLYGRALVYSMDELIEDLEDTLEYEMTNYENRLVDVKGTGVAPDKIPLDKDHSNGLHKLGYALVELVVGDVLQRIFNHSNMSFEILPTYAIIDFGFDNQTSCMPNGPCGLLLRRAHRRPTNIGGLYPYGSDGQKVQLAVEKILRKYGITSVNEATTIKVWRENGKLKIKYNEKELDFYSEDQLREIERVSHFKDRADPLYFDGINVQHTREIQINPMRATLVDFESYAVKPSFDNPLLSLVSDKLLRWGGTIWPEYENFVKAQNDCMIPYELMSAEGEILGYDFGENWSKLYSLCFGLAFDFSRNKITREEVMQTLEKYLSDLTGHLNKK